ncbi:MAG: WD40 repeat domain-containing protein [Cyanobacteria bacterium SZAS LIN-3]|nr:WD40 repeat domain-containing protein [Cyanobacteria bacterium SZAS LIN-3]
MDLKTHTTRTIGPKNGLGFFWEAKWSPNSELLACICRGDISIFDSNLPSKSPRIIETEHCTPLPGVLDWSKNGEYLIYSSTGRITVVRAKDLQEKYRIDTIESAPASFQLSPDGTKLAYLDAGVLNIRSFPQDLLERQIAAPCGLQASFRWSPNGKYLLLSSSEKSAVYLAESGRALGFTALNKLGSDWLPTSEGLVLSGGNVRILPLPQYAGVSKQSSLWNLETPNWACVPNPRDISECFKLLDATLSASAKAKIRDSEKKEDLYEFGGGSIITDGCIAEHWCKWGTGYIERECRKFGIYDGNDVLAYVIKEYRLHLKQQNK